MEWYYNFQDMIFQKDLIDKETGEMTWDPNVKFQSSVEKFLHPSKKDKLDEEFIELLTILKNRICFNVYF